MPPQTATSTSFTSSVGLVVANVGRYIVGIPIHSVTYILTRPHTIHVPRPRPYVLSLFDYDNRLIPIIDLRARIEGTASRDEQYYMMVREKDTIFAFPIGYIENITQIPIQRIRYPRHEEIAVDKSLVRGYWDYSARRYGYILNCAAIYRDIFGETVQATQGSIAEDHA